MSGNKWHLVTVIVEMVNWDSPAFPFFSCLRICLLLSFLLYHCNIFAMFKGFWFSRREDLRYYLKEWQNMMMKEC